MSPLNLKQNFQQFLHLQGKKKSMTGLMVVKSLISFLCLSAYTCKWVFWLLSHIILRKKKQLKKCSTFKTAALCLSSCWTKEHPWEMCQGLMDSNYTVLSWDHRLHIPLSTCNFVENNYKHHKNLFISVITQKIVFLLHLLWLSLSLYHLMHQYQNEQS